MTNGFLVSVLTEGLEICRVCWISFLFLKLFNFLYAF
jgi:hypothetical protein